MNLSAFWNRSGVLSLVLFSLSLMMLALGANTWLTLNREYEGAASDLQLCHRLTGEIVALRDRPRIASLEIESPQQTLERILAAQKHSQLASDTLLSVSPALSTRLGNTAYHIRNTELQLDQVTLVQLHQFASAITDNNQGLVVHQMSITPADRLQTDASIAAEKWKVRLVLTQLIYSPTSEAAK